MEAEARVEFSLPALAENVSLIRHALAGLAEALEMEPAEIADLKTVVTEACMNVVTHAYAIDETGLLEVDAWPEDGCLAVTVRDFGSGIRPLADIEHRSLRLGLPLIAALTKSFELSGAPGRGTEVTMVGTRASCHPIPVLMIVAPAASTSVASATISSQL